ncbi:hypothetical protein MUB24_00355 [Lederbergia sp. NSJ-179]|nr:hypothetical protein [Lederbergia sp. NSJ-179]
MLFSMIATTIIAGLSFL